MCSMVCGGGHLHMVEVTQHFSLYKTNWKTKHLTTLSNEKGNSGKLSTGVYTSNYDICLVLWSTNMRGNSPKFSRKPKGYQRPHGRYIMFSAIAPLFFPRPSYAALMASKEHPGTRSCEEKLVAMIVTATGNCCWDSLDKSKFGRHSHNCQIFWTSYLLQKRTYSGHYLGSLGK